MASSHASMPEKRASSTAQRRASAASVGRGERGARSQIPSIRPSAVPRHPTQPWPCDRRRGASAPCAGSARECRPGEDPPATLPRDMGPAPPRPPHPPATTRARPGWAAHAPGPPPPKPRDRPEPPPRQRPRPQRPAVGEELGRAGGRRPGRSYPLPRSRGQGPPAEPASETPRAKGRPREFHSRLRPQRCQGLPVSSSR